MELVNRIGDAIARKAGWPRARLGKFLRGGWMIIVMYLLLQFLVAGASLHDIPRSTGLMLLALAGVAWVTGLVFHHLRSFCTAFCPTGALLSVYSRYTPIQLEARDPSVCDRCTTKDCIRGENRYRFDKRSCPSLLKPLHRAASDGCVLCLQCVKVCPYHNMGFGIVSAEAPVRHKVLLKPYEAAFVMIELGFVVHELSEDVASLDAVYRFVPAKVAAWVAPASFYWIEALWFLGVFPLLVWAVTAAVAYGVGNRTGIRRLVLAMATGAAPVVAVAHLTKALGKLGAWGGFLPGALADPQGLETMHQFEQGVLTEPAALFGLSIVGWAMLPVHLAIAWRSWRWTRELPDDLWGAARSGMLAATLVFAPLFLVWGLAA